MILLQQTDFWTLTFKQYSCNNITEEPIEAGRDLFFPITGMEMFNYAVTLVCGCKLNPHTLMIYTVILHSEIQIMLGGLQVHAAHTFGGR